MSCDCKTWERSKDGDGTKERDYLKNCKMWKPHSPNVADSPKSTLQLGLLMCSINTLTGTTSNWSFTYRVTLDQYMLNKAHLMTSTVTTHNVWRLTRSWSCSPGATYRTSTSCPVALCSWRQCRLGSSCFTCLQETPSIFSRPYAQKNYQAHFTLQHREV